MKSSIASLVLVAGLVAAQSDKIPSCATSCITKYTTGDGIAGCGQLDIKCICSNSDFLDGIACCLDDACDDSGKAAAVKYAQGICSSSGVTVPDEVVCKASTSSKSASASASASSKSASEPAASESASEAASSSASASAATTTAEAASSDTASATDSAATTTASTDAAAGLSSAGGLLGAIMAMLVAL